MMAGGTSRGPALKLRHVHHAGNSSDIADIADIAAALLLPAAVKRVMMGSSCTRAVATANVERI